MGRRRLARSVRSAGILAAALLIAGCATPASPASPDAPEAARPEGAPLWSAALRSFSVPAGDTFGIIEANFTQADQHPQGGFGMAFEADGFPEDAYVSLQSFTWDGAKFVMLQPADRFGDGRFGVGMGSDRMLFVLVFHTRSPGTIFATAWTVEGGNEFDALFTRPAEHATWSAEGPAEISYYRSDGRAYGVVTSGAMTPGDPAIAFGGSMTIATKHAAAPGGLELSRSFLYGQAAGASMKATWRNGQATTERAFPAFLAAAPTPVRPYPGHRLAETSHGATSMSLEISGASAQGGLEFEHHSVLADLGAYGWTIAPSFTGSLD